MGRLLLTCQEKMVAGANVMEKCRTVADAGFQGIDFMGGTLRERIRDIKESLAETGLRPAAVYSQLGRSGGSSLVDESAAQRANALDLIKDRMEAAAEIGAGQLIYVPIFGASPLRAEASEWVLITMLDELAAWAKGMPVELVMEPLNRKQSQFLYDPRMGARLAAAVGSPQVRTMIDTYHMDLEDQDIPGIIREIKPYLALAHFSDTDRALPGAGQIDFRSALQALREVGYAGPIGLECGESTPSQLRACVEYLTECALEAR